MKSRDLEAISTLLVAQEAQADVSAPPQLAARCLSLRVQRHQQLPISLRSLPFGR